MSGERDLNHQRRVEEIFELAVALPGEQRGALLDSECDDNAGLRAEVERLLRADAEAGGFLETPVASVGELLGDEPWKGHTLGDYRLVRCIGEGGMATVYLAVRADDEYQKQVAVKLLRGGLEGPEAEQRLRRERQILASLEHPNIARLLDGGTTPNGAPFIVMEHVEGEPIDEYCQRRHLDISQRLGLFLQVLSAVQHAHNNLVVHRDLKPSNILVTEEGTPKLLDFGIAKLLNPKLAGQSDPTRADLLLLTPSYASPEQIKGRAITTASDVYSLGVVLYRLLTDASPYETDTSDIDKLVRSVCELDPPRPSRVLEQAGRRAESRQLRGDLDQIILKALEKEPAHRYQSVEQLAEDLRRFNRGLPVSARSASSAYLARKFLRRHRWGATFSLVLIAVLLGAGGHTVMQSARTAEALRVAEKEREKAEAINSFLLEMLTSASPNVGEGRDVTVIEAMASAEDSITDSLVGQPEIEAAVRRVIGATYRELGRFEESETTLLTALGLQRDALGRNEDVALVLNDLGLTKQKLGRLDEAETCFREALELDRQLLGPEAPATLRSLNNLAGVLRSLDRLDEVEQLCREILATYERSPFAIDEAEVATVHANLGILLMDKGDLHDAATELEQALAVFRRLHTGDHPDIASTQGALAMIYEDLGRYDEARETMHASIEMLVRLFGERHPAVGYNRYGFGRILVSCGQKAEAEQAYLSALEILSETLGPSHTMIADVSIGLANLYRMLGNWQEAERLLDRAEGIVVPSLGKESHLYGFVLGSRAWLQYQQGQFDNAEATARQALELRRKLVGDEGFAYGASLSALAAILGRQGRTDESLEAFAQAIGILETTGGSGAGRLVECRYNYGRVLIQVQRYDDAEDQLLHALQGLEANRGFDPGKRVDILDALIELYDVCGNDDRLADVRALRAATSTQR
jgi:serine/threonine protein kinase/Tfp pilus assembly protein PilF